MLCDARAFRPRALVALRMTTLLADLCGSSPRSWVVSWGSEANTLSKRQASSRMELGVAGSGFPRKGIVAIQTQPSKADHDPAGWKEDRMGDPRTKAAGVGSGEGRLGSLRDFRMMIYIHSSQQLIFVWKRHRLRSGHPGLWRNVGNRYPCCGCWSRGRNVSGLFFRDRVLDGMTYLFGGVTGRLLKLLYSGPIPLPVWQGPRPLASSGSFLPPKRSNATPNTKISSEPPRPSMDNIGIVSVIIL